MSKKELLSGAIISGVMIILMLFSAADVIEQNLELLDDPPIPLTSFFIGILAASPIYIFVLTILGILNPNGETRSLFQKFTIRAVIPWYFLVAFIPIALGITFAFYTRLPGWGMGLSCLSIPFLIIFYILAVRVNFKKKSGKGEGQENSE